MRRVLLRRRPLPRRPPPFHPALLRPPVPLPHQLPPIPAAVLAAGVARLLPEARVQGLGQTMTLSAGPTYGSLADSVPEEAVAQFLGQGYTIVNTRGEPYA